LSSTEHQWAYRIGDVVVAANFSEEPGELVRQPGLLLASSLGGRTPEDPVGGVLHLAGWEAVVVQSR
jgi:hypothetical protein